MPAKSRSQHSFIQKMYSILFLCFVLLLVSMFSITVFVTYKSQTKLINYSTNLLSDIFTGELEKIFTQLTSTTTVIRTSSLFDSIYRNQTHNESDYEQYLEYVQNSRRISQLISNSDIVDHIILYVPDDLYYARGGRYFLPLSSLPQSDTLFSDSPYILESESLPDSFTPLIGQEYLCFKEAVYDPYSPNELIGAIAIYASTNHIRTSTEILDLFEDPLLILSTNDRVLYNLNNANPTIQPSPNLHIQTTELGFPGLSVTFGFSTREQHSQVLFVIIASAISALFLLLLGSILYIFIYRVSKRRISKTLENISGYEHFKNATEIANPQNEFDLIDSSIYQLRNEVRQLLDENYKAGVKIKNLELKALRNSIDSHFLYNALDSISWTAINNEMPEIAKMIRYLAHFYKLTLNNGNDLISLKNQLSQVEYYLKLQLVRYEDQFTYEIITGDAIADCQIPNMLIQPIVENSLIHGIFKSDTSNGHITISATRSETDLFIDVFDNGCGIPEDLLTSNVSTIKSHKHGYGLKNINERIQLFSTPDSGVQMIPSRSGAHVRLLIQHLF